MYVWTYRVKYEIAICTAALRSKLLSFPTLSILQSDFKNENLGADLIFIPHITFLILT